MEYKCKQCLSLKPISDFYKQKSSSHGHMSKCKECIKSNVKKYRAENKEKIMEYDRNRPNKEDRKIKNKNRITALKYSNNQKFMETYVLPKRQWDLKNMHKKSANLKVSRAIQIGLLKRPKSCSKCAETKNIEAHHEDYSKPLDVIWLCTKCHGERHVEIRKEQRSKSA